MALNTEKIEIKQFPKERIITLFTGEGKQLIGKTDFYGGHIRYYVINNGVESPMPNFASAVSNYNLISNTNKG